MPTEATSGYRVEFADGTVNPTWTVLDEFTDEGIEAARRMTELMLGRPLPLSPKTDYPGFVVYDEAGDDVGGG